MKKELYLLASMLLLPFVSCTDEAQELESQLMRQIVMTTQDFEPEATGRTLYDINDEAIKCTWATNDTVGVFPERGAQAYFPMVSGAGTKNATFDGEGWALKDGYTYASYYPYIGNAYLDRNAVPVNYSRQTQVGNASSAHLEAYDYMVATPTASEFGSAQFLFKHLSALVQLRISVPQPATLTSVKLVTDTEAFAVKGEVDIMADVPGIQPIISAKEIVLDLQDVATTEENQVLTFYMMIPPVDLSGQTLKAMIASDKGIHKIALETKNFKAGTAYGLSGEMESTEAGYMDGVVSLAEAGTLKLLLGDDFLNITSLKVVGPINGDDVRCLRQMSGGDISDRHYDEKGTLASLDLSKASILQGGRWYFDIFSWGQYYTSNDEIGDFMFYYCNNLQNIVLPDDITSIGYRAFLLCEALTTIDIPDGVISIGNHAFNCCSSLTSIDIPKGVTSIGDYAFNGCSSLTSIDIPKGVTSIGNWAFSYCNLTYVTIGDGVTSIGASAFSECSSLTDLYCYATTPPTISSILNPSFPSYGERTTLYVPAGCLSTYQSSDWASCFKNIVEME